MTEGYLLTEHAHAQQGLLDRLMKPLRERNPQACYHSTMVAEYATWIGQLMKFDVPTQEKIYVSGLLHDLGKSEQHYITALRFNTTRDDLYFKKFNAHPQDGFEIITKEMQDTRSASDLELMDVSRFVALHHHIGSLQASRELVTNRQVQKTFSHIADWDVAYNVLMTVLIADEFDSRTNTAEIKIPPRPPFLPQPICKASEFMEDKFECLEQGGSETKFDGAFKPAFMNLTAQMREYAAVFPHS